MIQTQRTQLLGIFAVLGVILFQLCNVVSVGTMAPTLFGDTSVGIYWSTPELFLLVIVAFMFGEVAATGVILTSLGVSFAVEDPAFIEATIGSKLVALAAAAVARRFNWGLLPVCLLALQVDVFAFAIWAGLPEIIWPSLLVRLALWGATAILVYAVLYRKGGVSWSPTPR